MFSSTIECKYCKEDLGVLSFKTEKGINHLKKHIDELMEQRIRNKGPIETINHIHVMLCEFDRCCDSKGVFTLYELIYLRNTMHDNYDRMIKEGYQRENVIASKSFFDLNWFTSKEDILKRLQQEVHCLDHLPISSKLDKLQIILLNLMCSRPSIKKSDLLGIATQMLHDGTLTFMCQGS